ncbi:MAG: spore protein [Clostridiales bacterium]|nr:spore protein [Clostridiales bacterium]
MAENVKSSKKSKMKKRPQDWEDLKIEIAKELGLWDKVKADGWPALSAVESGRLGGIFSRRKKAASEEANGEIDDED